MILFTHGILKNDTNELIYLQKRNSLADIENKFMATKGEGVCVSCSVMSDSLRCHGL